MSWDLRRLADRWQEGAAPPGAVLLRFLGSTNSEVITLASRENPDASVRPRLLLRWDDGLTQQLVPKADTFFSCPTHKNLGDQEAMRVSLQQSALLLFSFTPRIGRRIAQAQLEATLLRKPRSRPQVGAFAVAPPAGPPAQHQSTGLSSAFDRDGGIDRHPAVLYAENFAQRASLARVASDPASRRALERVDRDPGPGFEPLDGAALRVRIAKGERLGINHQIRFAELGLTEPEEAYFRYHLRLGGDWDPVIDGGKLPGFAGTYGAAGWGMRPSDGTNGWSARGAFMRAEPDGAQGDSADRFVGTYAYTANTDGRSGEVWGWNRGFTGRLSKSRWYAIEQFVRMNTPGSEDGILRVWIDGVLAFERTDIVWRSRPGLRIESVWLNVYHGGTARTDRDLTLYIDNIVIAREPIGPGRFGGR